MLLVRLVASGKQPPALQLDECRCDDQELGRDLEVEALHRLDLGHERVHDVGQRDLVQVDPLLGDEPQQQVERPREDVSADLVCHEAEVTGRMLAVVGCPDCDAPEPRRGASARYPSAMERVFSGVQSSGSPHVGNYFGAFRQWVADQYDGGRVFCVVDLHALTAEHDPTQLRSARSRRRRGSSRPGSTPTSAPSSSRATSTSTPSSLGCSSAPRRSASCVE